MTISFEIPPEIAHELRGDGADLGREAKEAFLVDSTVGTGSRIASRRGPGIGPLRDGWGPEAS